MSGAPNEKILLTRQQLSKWLSDVRKVLASVEACKSKHLLVFDEHVKWEAAHESESERRGLWEDEEHWKKGREHYEWWKTNRDPQDLSSDSSWITRPPQSWIDELKQAAENCARQAEQLQGHLNHFGNRSRYVLQEEDGALWKEMNQVVEKTISQLKDMDTGLLDDTNITNCDFVICMMPEIEQMPLPTKDAIDDDYQAGKGQPYGNIDATPVLYDPASYASC